MSLQLNLLHINIIRIICNNIHHCKCIMNYQGMCVLTYHLFWIMHLTRYRWVHCPNEIVCVESYHIFLVLIWRNNKGKDAWYVTNILNHKTPQLTKMYTSYLDIYICIQLLFKQQTFFRTKLIFWWNKWNKKIYIFKKIKKGHEYHGVKLQYYTR